MNNVGIVVLAAGSSSRMSESKQLLRFNGESLLRKSVHTATNVSNKVVTILGAGFQEHKDEIADLPTDIAFNLDWNKGMGNSLKFGLSHLHKNYPDLDAVIIMVCDQPLLSEEVLSGLIAAYKRGNELVASAYGGICGVPALFDRQFFKELMKIQDKNGAKLILNQNLVFEVPFPAGITDIDTDRDWQKLVKG